MEGYTKLNINSYNNLVIRAILSSKKFEIKEVNEMESIKDLNFHKEQYQFILTLILKKDWEALNKIEAKFNGFREYLGVIKFYNENKELFIATVYDSDELCQDPELIDIFKF